MPRITRVLVLIAAFSAAGVYPAVGQVPRPELVNRVEMARTSMNPVVLVQGAAAARMLGQFAEAEELLRQATAAQELAHDAWINEKVFFALASGQGINGMQRAFREARAVLRLDPKDIAEVVDNFPELLVGGEYDEMILSLSADHPDPGYRCACQAPKAWVHKVAGNQHDSRVLWGELVAAWDRNPLTLDTQDAQANWHGQYARNLARAGRLADARRELAVAMAMPISDEARPGVERRWAQAYAELGQVEEAVRLLEPLIGSSTLVTVNSLATRYTWEGVRDNLLFQEMLARHR